MAAPSPRVPSHEAPELHAVRNRRNSVIKADPQLITNMKAKYAPGPAAPSDEPPQMPAAIGSTSTLKSTKSSFAKGSGINDPGAACDSEKGFAPACTTDQQSNAVTNLVAGLKNFSVDSDFVTAEVVEEMAAESDEDYSDDDAEGADPLMAALKYLKRQKQLELERGATVDTRFSLLIDDDDVDVLKLEVKQAKSVQRWVRFDVTFGSVVVVNGIVEGITSEKLVLETDEWVVIFQTVCLCLFIVEFAIRWFFEPTGLRGLLKAKWTCMDFFIISFSVIDLWILPLIATPTGGGGFLAILRISRLVRLVRLLRVLKHMRVFWFLVSGITRSCAILLWSIVLILVTCYIFGLLLMDLIMSDETMAADPQISSRWDGLGRTILTLVQISTFDDGTNIMREVVEGNHGKQYLMFIFLPFVAICSLGVLNLMVGVLLTASLEITQLDTTVNDSAAKLLRHEALGHMKELMEERCENEIGSEVGEPTITLETLQSWLNQPRRDHKHRSPSELMDIANITSEDYLCIFNEVANITNKKDPTIKVDDFIQGCLFVQSEVHPLHITNIMAGMVSMYSRLAEFGDFLAAIDGILDDASSQIRPLLKMFYVEPGGLFEGGSFNDDFAEKEEVKEAPKGDEHEKHEHRGEQEHAEFDMQVFRAPQVHDVNDHETANLNSGFRNRFQRTTGTEASMIRRAKLLDIERSVWSKFDAVIIIVILLNGLTIGLDASREDAFQRDFIKFEMDATDFAWLALELLFFAIYLLEFVLRSILYYQMAAGTHTVVKWFIPTLCFSMSRPVALDVLKMVPKMVKGDMYIWFDLTLLAFGFIDNVMLRFFAQDKFLLYLRIFRTLRLMRLARLLYLFHELVHLMGSIILAAPVVLWTVVLLGGLIYIVAVFAETVVKPEISIDNPIYENWSTLAESSYTLAKFALFSNWGEKGKEFVDAVGPWGYLFTMCFSLYAGLGLLNLATGVVVEAAFRVVARDAKVINDKLQKDLKQAAEKAVDRMFRYLQGKELKRKIDAGLISKSLERNYFLLWKLGLKEGHLKEEDVSHASSMGPVPTSASFDMSEAPTDFIEAPPPLDPEAPPGEPPPEVLGVQISGLVPSVGVQISTLVPLKPMVKLADSVSSFKSQGVPHSVVKVREQIIDAWASSVSLTPSPVDTSVIRSVDLPILLDDANLTFSIHKAGLRSDHLIMLFQRLDVMQKGVIKVEEFIEGVQRMKVEVQGVDVASAKSVARGLYNDAGHMAQSAGMINQTFLDIVCHLRGITPVGNDKVLGQEEQEDEGEAESSDIVQQAQMRVLTEQNRKIMHKIKNVGIHIEERLKLAERRGDSHASSAIQFDQKRGEEDDNISISSVREGKD